MEDKDNKDTDDWMNRRGGAKRGGKHGGGKRGRRKGGEADSVRLPSTKEDLESLERAVLKVVLLLVHLTNGKKIHTYDSYIHTYLLTYTSI